MQTQKIDLPLNIKSVKDSGEFSGYGSIFGNTDSYGDVVNKGAFDASLKSWSKKSRLPALLWQHQMDEPIGIYTRMEEDEKGLYVEGKLLINEDPLAKRAHAHLKAGSLSGMSIGFVTTDEDYDVDTGINNIKAVNLWEVSLVTFPANDDARISAVKSAIRAGETPQQKLVEGLLRDAGLSRQQAKAFMSQGYKGLSQREADDSLESLKNLTQKLKGITNV